MSVRSLNSIVSSIFNAQIKLTNISGYRARMCEHYRTSLNKDQNRDLNITQQHLFSLFVGLTNNNPYK